MKRQNSFFKPLVLAICLVVLSGCTYVATVRGAIAQRGQLASDQALATALWTLCVGTSTGSVARRFKTDEEKAARNTICTLQ